MFSSNIMDQCIIQIREEILKMVMNENTLKILNQITDNNNNNNNNNDKDGNTLSITKIGLTRKQFYTKLNELTTRGLIKKEKGKYYLTTFGKIVYDLTSEYKNNLYSIIEDCWKFKTLDLLDISDEFTNDEKHKIMEHLFNHINKNSVEQEKKNDVDLSNEKVLLSYTQFNFINNLMLRQLLKNNNNKKKIVI
jgi:DNA-binding HxlR family transcriptional regulator